MNRKTGSTISRREFARRAAIVSAVSLVPATDLQLQAAGAHPLFQPSDTPRLSAEGQAEAEARCQAILGLFAARFSDAQKTDLRRLCFLAQSSLDRLRAYPIENSDGPALYLKPLVERERNTVPLVSPRAGSQAMQKP